jgi:hypothetical protein
VENRDSPENHGEVENRDSPDNHGEVENREWPDSREEPDGFEGPDSPDWLGSPGGLDPPPPVEPQLAGPLPVDTFPEGAYFTAA